ncbi:uncharacterized protein TNCV_700301 [Trichonephila clavipes]|nr:uncharacterized protein TNCV_700301 [Trichonephila clavipes]
MSSPVVNLLSVITLSEERSFLMLYRPQGILPQNWVETELNCSVTFMVLKATANDRRHVALCHDEFRGALSGLCRSGGIRNDNNMLYQQII